MRALPRVRPANGPARPCQPWARAAALALACGALAACGGGSGGDADPRPVAGTVAITGRWFPGATLTATPAGFRLGTPAGTYHYAWQRCAEPACTTPVAVGADSSSYVVAAADGGAWVRAGAFVENACAAGCGASATAWAAPGAVADLDEVIGVATAAFTHATNEGRAGEAAIGNLVADAIRARAGTQLALVDGGLIRAGLPSNHLPADLALRRDVAGYAPGPPFDLVRADAEKVLPFGDAVATATITGAQLTAALEIGVGSYPVPAARFPQISGFRFTFKQSGAQGARVQSVTLADGTPITADSGATFTIALTAFLADGGDGYTVFTGLTTTPGALLSDELAAYVSGAGTITPALEGRITAIP